LHGLQDDIVPAKASEQLLHAMKSSPTKTEMLTFSGGHGIPGELIPRMQQRLNNWLL
jgi:phospholipase/carboxylesterase